MPSPTRCALVAVCLVALLAAPVSADISHVGQPVNAARHGHLSSKRMLKVREPLFGFGNSNTGTGTSDTDSGNGAGAADTTTTTTPAAAVKPAVTTTTTTPAAVVQSQPAASSTPAADGGSPDSGLTIVGGITLTVSNTGTSSALTTTSATTTSSALPTLNLATETTPVLSESAVGPSTLAIQSTIDALPTASAAAANTPSNTFGRNSIIAIVVIASCVGGAAAIWTLIRKWKLGPSSKFEDRMQPIEWSPEGMGAGAAAGGLDREKSQSEKIGRRGSAGSHGSFHSGESGHNNLGRNVTGNANLFADQNPVDAHDFTAGPVDPYNAAYGTAGVAPGYVDLQRANSGGRAAELTREPSRGAYGGGYDQSAYGAYGGTAQDAYAQDAYGGYDAYGQQPQHDAYAQHGQYGGYQGGRY